MIETHSQSGHAPDSWNAAPPRAVGLYGELQPLPLPAVAPPTSARAHKPAAKSGLTG
jgi:hypothetical protein